MSHEIPYPYDLREAGPGVWPVPTPYMACMIARRGHHEYVLLRGVSLEMAERGICDQRWVAWGSSTIHTHPARPNTPGGFWLFVEHGASRETEPRQYIHRGGIQGGRA